MRRRRRRTGQSTPRLRRPARPPRTQDPRWVSGAESPDLRIPFAWLREHDAGDVLAVARQVHEDLLRMTRKPVLHPADGVEILEVQRSQGVMPGVPRTQERMLQDRQLVGVVAGLIEQTLHQTRRDLGVL